MNQDHFHILFVLENLQAMQEVKLILSKLDYLCMKWIF